MLKSSKKIMHLFNFKQKTNVKLWYRQGSMQAFAVPKSTQYKLNTFGLLAQSSLFKALTRSLLSAATLYIKIVM